MRSLFFGYPKSGLQLAEIPGRPTHTIEASEMKHDKSKRKLYLPEGKQSGWKKKPSKPMVRSEKRDRRHENYLREIGFQAK